MELATSNLGSLSTHMISDSLSNPSTHMISDSLSNPIWNFMDGFPDSKTDEVNNFDSSFYSEPPNHSDSENDSKQNGIIGNPTKSTENHDSINGYENLISYPMDQNFNPQTCLPNTVISPTASMGNFDILPSRFDWGSFAQPSSENILTTFSPEGLSTNQDPDIASQRRSSFPGNAVGSLPDFPNLSHGRRRVVSWGDLSNNSPMNVDNMNLSLRRSSINIPLQKGEGATFIDIMNQNNGKPSIVSEDFSSPPSAAFTVEDQISSDNNTKSKETKKSTKISDPELQQTVVEKRLNRRRERNRLAARRSREKRTQFLHDLERVNQALQSENNQLKSKLCDVMRELEALRNATSQR